LTIKQVFIIFDAIWLEDSNNSFKNKQYYLTAKFLKNKTSIKSVG